MTGLNTSGATFVAFNPEVFNPVKPSGGFEGTGFWSSGIIGLDDPTGFFLTTFSMTFTKAGSYEYMCALHRSVGMDGSVMVIGR